MQYLVINTYRDFPLFGGCHWSLEEAFEEVVAGWRSGIGEPIVMRPTMDYPFANFVSLEKSGEDWKPTPFKAWTTGPDHLNHWYIVPLFEWEDRMCLADERTPETIDQGDELKAQLRREFSEELVFSPDVTSL